MGFSLFPTDPNRKISTFITTCANITMNGRSDPATEEEVFPVERKDVFISYKSEDFDQAQWLKSVLETNDISCWMAPSSIPGGSSYAREIPLAIENCRVFVVVLTRRCQDSIWVPKELDRALNSKKPVMPFVLEDCTLTDDFNFYLSNVQRYNAYQNKVSAAEQMLRDIRALLNVRQEPFLHVPVPPVAKQQTPSGKKTKKPLILVAVIAAVCLLAGLLLSGLGVTRVDAFQDLQISLEGAAPYAKVNLTNNSPDPFLQSIHYSATPDSNLDLGDKVTITANISKEDAKSQGYKLKSHTKEFTVENIPSVVTDPALLSAADVAALQQMAEKYIRGQGTGYPQIEHADGDSSDLPADKLANSMTDFAFLEKAYVCTHTAVFEEQKTLIIPFCLKLEDVPYSWVDNQYHDEPVLVDYPALYGYFSFTDLMVDEAGNLIKTGSFGIDMSDLFESKDVMDMKISKQYPGGEKVSGTLQFE